MAEEVNLAATAGEILAEFQCNKLQIPPPGKFNSDDIQWYPCKKPGKRELCLEAWIPLECLDDFIKGESSKPEFQCSFKIRKTVREEGRVIRRYWCAYGPQDERKVVLRDWATMQNEAKGKGGRGLGSKPARKTVDVGLSSRRSCRCHFTVMSYANKEGIVMVFWIEQRHVDLAGQYCHGVFCQGAEVSNAQIAPKLSKDCLMFVERLLRSGLPPGEILSEHMQRIADAVRKVGSREELEWTRDMELSMVDYTLQHS